MQGQEGQRQATEGSEDQASGRFGRNVYPSRPPPSATCPGKPGRGRRLGGLARTRFLLRAPCSHRQDGSCRLETRSGKAGPRFRQG